MIFHYHFSIAGSSHETNGAPCEDASAVIANCTEGWVIAASADGVGSCAHAKTGSTVAVQTALQTLINCFDINLAASEVHDIIRATFSAAFSAISQRAVEEGNPIEDYETTLDIAIYDGSVLHFGHSGDGGIFGMKKDGTFVEITQPQKEERFVIPLSRGSEAWEIGTYEYPLVSVLLVTDGMRKALWQAQFRTANKHGVNLPSELYVPNCTFFMDSSWLNEQQGQADVFEKNIGDYLNNKLSEDTFYKHLLVCYSAALGSHTKAEEMLAGFRKFNMPMRLMKNITDDKTVVGLINTEVTPAPRPPAYYEEVDWIAIRLAVDKVLYPHLYPNEIENV